MTEKVKSERLVDAEALEKLVVQILERVDVPKDEAHLLADALISADTRGNNSHGIMRLPVYVDRIQSGGIRPGSKGRILRERASTVLLDGEDGIGQVVTTRAMAEATRKAKEAGAGVVGVRCSNHFGEAAFYVLQAVRKDMIGLIVTNASPTTPLWGTFTKLTGNSAVAIGIPSGAEYPIVLDMALGAVALGKIMYAASKRETIPLDWGVDAGGKPTDDPNQVLAGGWTPPIGKYKGSGLMVVAEVLTGVLTGGGFSNEIGKLYADPASPQGLAHFVMAIDVESFIPLEQFKPRVDGLISLVKGSEPAPGVEEILLPGEREFRLEKRRRTEGIPLSLDVLGKLRVLAEERSIKYTLDG